MEKIKDKYLKKCVAWVFHVKGNGVICLRTGKEGGEQSCHVRKYFVFHKLFQIPIIHNLCLMCKLKTLTHKIKCTK